MATTPNYGWEIPDVNSDADTWGTIQNALYVLIDAAVFGKFSKAGGTLTGKATGVTPAAGGSGYASFNFPHGVAPTTNIADGDGWTTTAGLFVRINGATKTVFFAEGGTVSGATTFGSTVTLSADPTTALQAATKQYVDSVATGLQIKNAVSLATTANVTLSGEQTIDGTLTSASRILVKSQTAPAENGTYTTGAGAWTRTTDMDAWSEVTGALVFVTGGSTNAGKRYYSTATAGGTLNTTAINFVLYDSVTSYTGSGGITLSGSDFRLANMATQTFKGRTTAGTGAPEDLTATEATAMLNAMVGDSGSGGTKGLVPAPAAGDADKALLGDGTWGGLPLYGVGYGAISGSSASFTGSTGIDSFVRASGAGKWVLTTSDALEAGWVAIVLPIYTGSTILGCCEDQGVSGRTSTGVGYQFRTAGNTAQDPLGVNIMIWGKVA